MEEHLLCKQGVASSSLASSTSKTLSHVTARIVDVAKFCGSGSLLRLIKQPVKSSERIELGVVIAVGVDLERDGQPRVAEDDLGITRWNAKCF